MHMALDAQPGRPPDYRCVGVGVGPSNLSLASLLHGRHDVPNVFFEKSREFGWHDGQQIPGSSLQVSILKDLVSLADPTSAFSFLSYLHSQGRIYHFINAQFEAVPRQEFRNYLEWVCQRNPNVLLGEKVTSVDFDGSFVVTTSKRTVTAENVVIGVGSQPWVPPQASLGDDTQFHVSDFITKAKNLAGLRVGVVGGGQSGAEAFLDLISRSGAGLPRRVSWISRRSNFFPIDDSPFTNDYYMPCHSDHFANLPLPNREAFNVRHVLTSDGISESTLREIYQVSYIHRFVQGRQDLIALYPNRALTNVTPTGGSGWTITTRHNDDPNVVEQVEVDLIVWATGFRPASTDFLAPIAHRLQHEGLELAVDDSFAVRWDGPPDRNIFVQNGARQQRGLADPNLSLVAWRSQRIVDRIRGVRSTEQLPSFIEWWAKAPADELDSEIRIG